MSEREVVVHGAARRHQVRQYLKLAGVEWLETGVWSPARVGALAMNLPDGYRFTFESDDEQWDRIQAWVKKVTG